MNPSGSTMAPVGGDTAPWSTMTPAAAPARETPVIRTMRSEICLTTGVPVNAMQLPYYPARVGSSVWYLVQASLPTEDAQDRKLGSLTGCNRLARESSDR